MTDINLARVSGRIARHVVAFAQTKGTFHPFGIEVLQEYVRRHATIAPASPDRVLRDLRHRGVLDYVVIDRSIALYQFTRVPA